jgi:hypothetical protein
VREGGEEAGAEDKIGRQVEGRRAGGLEGSVARSSALTSAPCSLAPDGARIRPRR